MQSDISKLKMFGFCAVILTVAFSVLHFVYAVDQMKSTDVLVFSSSAAVSAATSSSFTLYIGDSLAGVTLPLKSISFTIGGVYTSTAAGTLEVKIDNDPATAQIFDLPHVSTTPTPFQIVYRDPSGKVNPTTAGSYTYTLTMTPSNVTIYNLSALASETHRYTPAACADGTGDKMKTQEFVAAQYAQAVTSATSSSFSFYLGDDFTGVSSPVKSAHFTVHGVYTGAGSITVKLDLDAATAQTFALPSATAPTYFEFVYKDPTDSVNHTSNGTWTHTITSDPSGVTIYDHGIVFVETHRYKPPSCGGMPIKGELYSAVFETTGTSTGPSYNSIVWKGVLGGPSADQGKVRFQLAASDCSNGATNAPTCSVGTWSFVGGATCSSADWFDPAAADTPFDLQKSGCIAQWNNKRYFRYAVQICSNDCVTAGTFTPRVDDVILNWSP